MKRKFRYGLLALAALAFGACTKEPGTTHGGGSTDEEDLITFDIFIPDEIIVDSRSEAIPEGAISNMYVLVFDHNGGLLSRTEAIRTGGTGQYTVRLAPTDPDLPADEKKRTVHFVANYDWTGWRDIYNLGKHENEVIGNMAITVDKTCYWQNIILTNGITSGSFPSKIELIRNKAKVTVEVNSPNLSNSAFALGDYINYGTVAPFNTETLKFEENAVMEAPQGTLQPASSARFGATGSTELMCYERKNSESLRPMYVILRGRYTGDTQNSFYKIDLVIAGQETPLDIIRNHHYQVVVTSVNAPGYPTMAEAVANPASNNIQASVILKDYPSISNGISGLTVEKTLKTIVKAGQQFYIGFSYYPDLASDIENNTNVTFSINQDNARRVIQGTGQLVKTPGGAYFTATTVSTIPQYETYTAEVVIKGTTNGVELRRVVELRLRRPTDLSNVKTIPATIPGVNGELTLSFTIPSDFDTKHFPLDVYITTKKLSPNKSYKQLNLDYQIPGDYRYRYVANATGTHNIYFVVNSTGTSETLKIESELFNTKTLNVAN